MRFFMPELYLRFNSAEADEADRADADWEAAIRDYQRHLESFEGTLSPRIGELAEDLCLHDAELFSLRADPPGREGDVSPIPRVATMALKQDDRFVHLDYLLWGAVIQTPPEEAWPNASSPVYWLYDEVDCDPREGSLDWGGPLLWHRILLSDGRVLAIPFVDVIVNRFSLEKPETALVERVEA